MARQPSTVSSLHSGRGVRGQRVCVAADVPRGRAAREPGRGDQARATRVDLGCRRVRSGGHPRGVRFVAGGPKPESAQPVSAAAGAVEDYVTVRTAFRISFHDRE